MKYLMFVAVLLIIAPSSYAVGDNSAELIHFTKDGTLESDSLYPGFRHHSCWNGAGVASDGNIYIAVSNHYQPSGPGETQGDVAMFRYDPEAETLAALGRLSEISGRVNNWMPTESQHKVHTVISEHADGKLYFATDDYEPSFYLRGSHLYSIDPATGTVTDESAAMPYVMKRDFTVIPNVGTLSDTAGVFIQYYGIKGLKMNRNAPNLMYAMLYGRPDMVPETGHIIRYDMDTGALKKIGEADDVPYRMHVDASGELYYVNQNGSVFDLMKYSPAADSVSLVTPGMSESSIGGIAPSPSGDTVYMSSIYGQVFRIDCLTDSVEEFSGICGAFSWKHFNLALAPDGKNLYYIIVQGSKGVYRISTRTGACEKVLDMPDVIGDRTLAFDGINVWDRMGKLYVPVWNGSYNPPDMALVRLELNQTTDYNGFIAHPRIQEQNATVAFRAHLNDGVTSWHWDYGDGDAETTTRHLASHAYAEVGWYTVTLTTTGSEGTKVYRRQEYVRIDPESFTFEAEGMDLAGKYVIDEDPKAAGTWIKIDGTGEPSQDGLTGTATCVFAGPAGDYDIRLLAVPENDGPSTVDLDLNGTELGSWVFSSDPMYFGLTNRDTFWVRSQQLAPGDTMVITGYSNNGAYARFDRLDCLPLNAGRVARALEESAMPDVFLYPLPAKGRLSFSVTGTGARNITVLDTRGDAVRTLGADRFGWDGRDDAGRPVRSGMYVLRVTNGAGEVLQPFMFVE